MELQKKYQYNYIPKEAIVGENRYTTHDNGGRTFSVVITQEKIEISGQRKPPSFKEWCKQNNVKHFKPYYVTLSDEQQKLRDQWDIDYDNILQQYEPLYEIKEFQGFFQGYDCDYAQHHGGSILIHIKDKTYIEISYFVYQFDAPETILQYTTNTGNSDVHYTFALSENYAYFLSCGDPPCYISQQYIMESVNSPQTAHDLVNTSTSPETFLIENASDYYGLYYGHISNFYTKSIFGTKQKYVSICRTNLAHRFDNYKILLERR